MGRHASPAAHAVRLGGVVLFFAACVALRGHTFMGVGGGAGRRLGDLEPSEHSAGSVSSIDPCLLLMNDTINSAANVRKNEGQLVCQEDYCEDLVGGYINYMKFHVCTLQGQPFVGYALLVAWLCVQFYLLADTADAFFVPVLQQIVALFQVQPALAGITFLSFGNGAPDVFATVASFSQPNAADIGVGSLLGSGMFVTTLVLAAVAFATDGDGKLKRRPFLRDIVFYMATLSWLLYIEIDGHVTMVKSSLFVIFYILFVAFVLLSRQVYLKYFKRVAPSPAADPDAFDSSLDAGLLGNEAGGGSGMFEPQSSQPMDDSRAENDTTSLLFAKDEVAGDLWGWDGGLRLKLRSIRKHESHHGTATMGGAVRSRGHQSLTAAEYHRRLNDLDAAGFHISKPSGNPRRNARSSAQSASSSAISFSERSAISGDGDDLFSRFEDSADHAAAGWVRSANHAGHNHNHHQDRDNNRPGAEKDAPFDPRSVLYAVLEDFQDQGIVGKILYPLLAPLTLVRRLSIPILGNDFNEDWEEGEADEVARLQREGLVEEGGIGSGGGPSPPSGRDQGGAVVFDVEEEEESTAEEKSKFNDGNDEGEIDSADGNNSTIVPSSAAGPGQGTEAEGEEDKEDEEEDEDGYPWSKGFAIASCLCLPVIGGLGTIPNVWIVQDVFPLWALFVAIGVVFAIVTIQGTTTKHPPRSRGTAKIFLAFGFTASILWIYFIANELVTILNTLGILMGISNSVLGLTVLAWANSAPDTVSIVGVARSGYVQMAIGGVYAGRMFDTLVGLGLGLTIGTLRAKGGELMLHGGTVLYFSFACLMLSVVSAGIVVPLSGFKYSKKFGVFLGVLYVVWMVLAILAAVGVIQTKLV